MLLLMRCVICFFLVFGAFYLIAAEEPHHTTAFISSPNSIDTLISYSFYRTDHFWNNKRNKLPTFNRFKKSSYSIYSEYAFHPYNSVFINSGYSSVAESMNGHSSELKDVELGWKHLLCNTNESALTLECVGIFPTGTKKSSIRYGKFGFQASLLYSHLFLVKERTAWTDMGIGYRIYQGFPSDEVRAFLTLGYQLASCVSLVATSELEYGVFNGDSKSNLNNIVNNPNHRLFSGKIESVFRLMKNLSVSAGAFQHFWGQNVGAGGGYFCGAWLDF